LLESAEWYSDVSAKIVIDTHRSNAYRGGNPVCRIDIVAPDGPRQAVDRIVRDCDRILRVLESNYRHDRPENLFLGNAHIIINTVKNGGFVVATTRVHQNLIATKHQ